MRSVKKPHGLRLIDDGPFFWYGARDLDEPGRSFPAVVEVQSYYPVTPATCLIRTPAEQLIWETIYRVLPIEIEGRKIEQECFVLTSPIARWLDNNAPGWGMPRYQPTNGGLNPGIYFEKRAHALAFCQMIGDQLKDMTFDVDD